MPGSAMHLFCFSCFDVNVNICCDDSQLIEILRRNFEAMKPVVDSAHKLDYQIHSRSESQGYKIRRSGSGFACRFDKSDELVPLLEGDLVVQLQLRRPDLLFLHSAVVGFDDHAHLLVGKSGAGKSTTCWGLLHHGFRYVSDELAPIVVDQGMVLPYLHALSMKSPPPAEYPVTDVTCAAGRGFRIPPSAMPTGAITTDLPVATIFFVEHKPGHAASTVTPLAHAEAAIRLYPNMLNALAHQNDGLAAARRVTEHIASFRVDAGFLVSTCEAICRAIKQSA